MTRGGFDIDENQTGQNSECGKKKEAVLITIMLVTLAITAGIVVWVVGKDSSNTPSKASGTGSAIWTRSVGDAWLTNDLVLEILDNGTTKFQAKLDFDETISGEFFDCSNSDEGVNKPDICLQWPDRKLTINYTVNTVHDLSCYDVEWTASQCVEQVLTDCVTWDEAHWYGGFQDHNQPWPLGSINRTLTAYVANDSYIEEIGGVLERYFFNTNGSSIFIHNDVPLYLSINNPMGFMCFVAKFDRYPYLNRKGNFPTLKYKVCQAADVKEIHQKTSAMMIPRPTDIPDPLLFKAPIWSTWAKYHYDINQSTVLEFANSILAHNFPHSQLEIDDDWTPRYGDMVFNISKFSNATEMVRNLNELGFRVTVWVHPFFNFDSENFLEAAKNRYLIRAFDSPQPAFVSWWDGALAGILDVTNEEAVEWFLSKLDFLQQEYNISSFKFDAGEIKWMPKTYSVAVDEINPNDIYPKQWVHLATRSDHVIRHQEVRVGYHTQSSPVFVRMMDKFSRWDHANGIKSLIPSALTFGILGYPFVLPDMIGGNAYSGLPDAELFIRWVQVNTFLPSMQFSVVPWLYNSTVSDIARAFTKLHVQYADKIVALARESVTTGSPIVRPLWWIAPDDQEAWTCETEYLLGNDLLVAPVLEQGARQRDVYLPAGTWQDQLRNTSLVGGQWYYNYSAEIDELPYFIRQN